MRPTKEALAAEYERLGSAAAVGELYGASQTTVLRWFEELGIEARSQGTNTAPENRRGGRPRKDGKPAVHVDIETARKMRYLHMTRPELSLTQIAEAVGSNASREYVRLVLAGKRIAVPEAFPDAKGKPPTLEKPAAKAPPAKKAPRVLASVLPRRGK